MAGSTTVRHVDPLQRRGPLYLALCRFSATRLGAMVAVHVSWKLDPLLLRATGGRVSTAWPLVTGLLETRGARTGRHRHNATLYFHDGDRVIIVASRRGEPTHPGWYHNLRAHPEVTFGGQPFHAETVTDDDEVVRLWALADRVFPPFVDYRRQAARSGRIIPIVRLTAIPTATGSTQPTVS